MVTPEPRVAGSTWQAGRATYDKGAWRGDFYHEGYEGEEA